MGHRYLECTTWTTYINDLSGPRTLEKCNELNVTCHSNASMGYLQTVWSANAKAAPFVERFANGVYTPIRTLTAHVFTCGCMSVYCL
eukprot:11548336-Alexandrium_andersonii.AAC.1